MAKTVLSKERVDAMIDTLYETFKLKPFSTKQALETLDVSDYIFTSAQSIACDRLRLLATFSEDAEWRDHLNGSSNWYTFDMKLNKFDFLDQFDPIPKNKRTLQPQLFGEHAVRLREVKDYIWHKKLPPYPIDRPLDFWEMRVFKQKNNKPLIIGD